MNASCDACVRGPSKVDGHAGLMVQSLGTTGMIFKCRECALMWMRPYSGNGHYGWTRLADRMATTAWFGISMPPARPRPATAEVAQGGAALNGVP